MVAHPEGLSFLRWCHSESAFLHELRRDIGLIPQKSPPRLDRSFSGKKTDLGSEKRLLAIERV
jgi:hypothetical protein